MNGSEGAAFGSSPLTVVALQPGDSYEGTVLRIPQPGAHDGNALHIRDRDGATYRLPATARKGHAVLERELDRQGVRVGDRVKLTYRGFRRTRDGVREYRDWRLDVER